jgi:DNA end-binding protein Ku
VRPHWKGYLKLALVSCPIALHAACSTSERSALRQVNKATGNRLRQQLIDERPARRLAPNTKPAATRWRRPSTSSWRMRSSTPSRSRAPIRRDRQLRARAQIDQRFFDTPYYITPNAPVGQEAFAVIREAMRGKPLLAPRGVNSPSPARLAEIRLTVWATGRHSAAAGIGQGR